MPRTLRLLLIFIILPALMTAQTRAREYGITIGVMDPGPLNAITDVAGVSVGHVTLLEGDAIRTGVTVIRPHPGDVFQDKVPAAIYLGNGFGKLAGYSQVEELGNLETPIALTNTLSVAAAMKGLVDFTLQQEANSEVRSVNAVVGETNDGYLNDIRGQHLRAEHVLEALRLASTGPVQEGNVGAGTGTSCFGFKGGIGTASRLLPRSLGGYTVGVMVQTNFGGVLRIDGVPVGEALGQYDYREDLDDADGSCMMVVATDAPLDARNLKRLAKRAFLGLGRSGGIASNGSGDYVIAFSTAEALRVPYSAAEGLLEQAILPNDRVSPLFMAAIEATEEAIINSLFAAETLEGRAGHFREALPVDRVLDILRQHGRLKE